ncbi:hypothetical protein [Accumulibacter sp.]|uniref:hypothetical protein n=1 Tax=Accumulibacter sp. TaxID=2053492 RepID=UPI002634A314|nr:hypothetical protein [Accumulibacter sp.]
MKNKFLVHSLLAIAMTCASFVTNASPDGGPVFHEAGGLAYASGGVGEESRQLLSARASEFNLKLVFAMTSGAYTSGVRVAIADAKGKTLLERPPPMDHGSWRNCRWANTGWSRVTQARRVNSPWHWTR